MVHLINESRILAKILRKNGFEVFGIACKAGTIDKTCVGIDESCKKVGDNMCNLTNSYYHRLLKEMD